MIIRSKYCDRCEEKLCEGETVYVIGDLVICEDCIGEYAETYEPEDSDLDYQVDSMRDDFYGY